MNSRLDFPVQADMLRDAMSMTFVVATRNKHKVQEIQSILAGTHSFFSLSDLAGAPEITEDADTFAGNALKKAEGLARWLDREQAVRAVLPTGAPIFVLADDSGLEVNALDGAPGVHSARFAALDNPERSGNASDAENNRKLLDLLGDLSEAQRTARFRCVLALLPLGQNSGAATPQFFEGACQGRIGWECQGDGGFGYDPLFIPDGYERTFAQLGDSVKNQLSHRSRALEKLKAYLEKPEEGP